MTPMRTCGSDADANSTPTTSLTTMKLSAFDAPCSALWMDSFCASKTSQEERDSLRNAHVAHVRYVAGDDHLCLQLRICNDHKTFNRQASEKLDKVRHRIQILAAQAADGANEPYLGNRTRKERNKVDQLHTQSIKICVRFFAASNLEIDPTTVTAADGLMHTDHIVIGDTKYIVLKNQPRVLQLTVMHPVLAGIPVLPLPETEFCDADDCQWRWYRLDSNGIESFLCDSRRYVPTLDDLDCRFRIECHAPSMHSQFAHDSTAQVTTTPVMCGPDRSVFEPRRQFGQKRASCEGDAFRVMSYNVLFDGYTTSLQAKTEIYPYAKHEILQEMYRMQLVFQEIEEVNADIVCLQEMGRGMFESFFEPMMKPLGYYTLYTGKTGTTHEGCAILVRKDCFDVIEEHTLAVSAEALICEDAGVHSLLNAYPEVRKGLKKIPSIAQLLVLRDKRHPSRHVLLSNTHLFYREDGDMIRVIQAIATVRAIERLQAQLAAYNYDAAVVICGDLNAVPDSATVHFLLDGEINDTHRHWQELRDFRWIRNDTSTPSSSFPLETEVHRRITHSLALTSACGIPEFTNFAGSFVATLDYILLGERTLTVAQLFPLFTREQVSHEVALPSTTFPSDHISLIADLKWRSQP